MAPAYEVAELAVDYTDFINYQQYQRAMDLELGTAKSHQNPLGIDCDHALGVDVLPTDDIEHLYLWESPVIELVFTLPSDWS